VPQDEDGETKVAAVTGTITVIIEFLAPVKVVKLKFAKKAPAKKTEAAEEAKPKPASKAPAKKATPKKGKTTKPQPEEDDLGIDGAEPILDDADLDTEEAVLPPKVETTEGDEEINI